MTYYGAKLITAVKSFVLPIVGQLSVKAKPVFFPPKSVDPVIKQKQFLHKYRHFGPMTQIFDLFYCSKLERFILAVRKN